MKEPVASMSGIDVRYRRRGEVAFAISNFSLEVSAGDLIHLRGPSGSGKSTILRVLAGLQQPDGGEVWLRGVPIYQRTVRERALLRGKEIGFVFQSVHLLPMFDAITNVMIPRLIVGGSRALARRDAHALMHRFGVAHRAAHKPHELSGGEQRRVGLARAMINEPGLILADEPFADLDPDSGGLVWEAICEWVKHGRTVIVSSHVDLPGGQAVRIVDLPPFQSATQTVQERRET